jgi:hypothetical protein
MATSLTHRERGRALGENYAQLTPSSTLVVSNFGPFVIDEAPERLSQGVIKRSSSGERVCCHHRM